MNSHNPSSANGIFLGTTLSNNEFRLPLEYLPYHFAFYGVTGSGKTRLAMKLAIEAEKNGIKLLTRAFAEQQSAVELQPQKLL